MRLLCDNPSVLKEALGNDETIAVDYSPALDIYTKDNALLQTLKGFYVSSKLDLTDEGLLAYLKEIAKPAVSIEPVCHPCYNYEDFDNFCKQYLDNETTLKVAYDVETTAAPFLSKKYKLAGFSLANCVEHGCYVILESIDYINPDIDRCLERLREVITTHNMLVFNAQHEYLATNICLNTDLVKESKGLDDAYSMALVMKTESFKADVFKLKLLCHRLLGTDNWASIIDDYIDLAMDIAKDSKYDFNDLTDVAKEKIYALHSMLEDYGYDLKDAVKFVAKIQKTYPDWKEQNTIPYTLIPSKMIMKYGCYDSCYLVKLFEFFENWVKDLETKLQGSLNSVNISQAYKECVEAQIMSAILTVNGIFISDERDEEVRVKSAVEVEKYYNKLWEVISDTTGKNILREFVKHDEKQRLLLEKNYLLPKYLLELIPDGFKFISTTPTFYSFLVEKQTDDLDSWIENEGLKPASPKTSNQYKILQKHLKPFSVLEDEDKLLDGVLDEYFSDMIKKEGSLSKSVFKPMSGPDALFSILTADLMKAHFLDRVVLYEYDNLPDKEKNPKTTEFLKEHNLYSFDEDVNIYLAESKKIKGQILHYLSKQYPYKDIYTNLVKDGLHSFASPIISYIYDVFTTTGCSVDNPKHSAFDFICRLKICRKYLRIVSTFIAGSSGGYACQKLVDNSSINNNHLVLFDDGSVMDEKTKVLKDKLNNTSRVVFGSWYANTAETSRWQATVHNVPAGAYCKRRFVSRYPGGFILANDMSQAEIRELAAVSKCEKLLDVLRDPNIDVHKMTASLAFDVPYNEVTSTQRKQIKTGVFSIVYGRDEKSLAQELFKGDHAAAKRLMDSIFKVYPEVSEYLEDAKRDARKYGYLVTRRGYPIFVNPYTQENKDKGESGWVRNIYNYGIQGGAAGFCTGTLVNVQKLLDKYNLKSKIVCYIHDAVYLDCPPDEFDKTFTILNTAFNQLATKKYNLPTASDTEFGVSMGSSNEITRLDKWHYKIEGNKVDVDEALKQFEINFNVEIIEDNLGEIEHHEDDVNWIFTPRSELSWHSQTQDYEVEIKLAPKF